MASFPTLLGWLADNYKSLTVVLIGSLLIGNSIWMILLLHLYPTDKMTMLASILSTGQLTGEEPTSVLENALMAIRHDISVEEEKKCPDYDLIHRLATVSVRVQTALNNRRGLDGMTLLAR